jgi:hypothetical protein
MAPDSSPESLLSYFLSHFAQDDHAIDFVVDSDRISAIHVEKLADFLANLPPRFCACVKVITLVRLSFTSTAALQKRSGGDIFDSLSIHPPSGPHRAPPPFGALKSPPLLPLPHPDVVDLSFSCAGDSHLELILNLCLKTCHRKICLFDNASADIVGHGVGDPSWLAESPRRRNVICVDIFVHHSRDADAPRLQLFGGLIISASVDDEPNDVLFRGGHHHNTKGVAIREGCNDRLFQVSLIEKALSMFPSCSLHWDDYTYSISSCHAKMPRN